MPAIVFSPPLRSSLSWLILLLALVPTLSCQDSVNARSAATSRTRLVFKYQPLGADEEPLRRLLAAYEATHPAVEVVAEAIPNASDVAHQYFLTALEGGTKDFDVLVLDVVWVQEFARAGWIADLSAAFSSETIRRDFLPGTGQAVVMDGRTFAVPWYTDVGLLYYRTDILSQAPRTYAELEHSVRTAIRAHPNLEGYLWQGRQSEGLVCNVYETIWGQDPGSQGEDRLQIDTAEARAALVYLRSLVTSGLSPPSVTSAAEEDSRRTFQSGRAVAMRNWPYAWAEAEREGSPIRGRVAFAALPTLDGSPGHGTLGGWQLAVNAASPPQKRERALSLIAYLTSTQSNVALALAYSRSPSRRAAYENPELISRAPFWAALRPILEEARPRPVTAYYNLLTDVLQSEFSAAISGIRPPREALRRAQRQIERITAGDPG